MRYSWENPTGVRPFDQNPMPRHNQKCCWTRRNGTPHWVPSNLHLPITEIKKNHSKPQVINYSLPATSSVLTRVYVFYRFLSSFLPEFLPPPSPWLENHPKATLSPQFQARTLLATDARGVFHEDLSSPVAPDRRRQSFLGPRGSWKGGGLWWSVTRPGKKKKKKKKT